MSLQYEHALALNKIKYRKASPLKGDDSDKDLSVKLRAWILADGDETSDTCWRGGGGGGGQRSRAARTRLRRRPRTNLLRSHSAKRLNRSRLTRDYACRHGIYPDFRKTHHKNLFNNNTTV